MMMMMMMTMMMMMMMMMINLDKFISFEDLARNKKWCIRMYIKANNVYSIKNKLRFFKSSENINKKRDGPYRGFDY